MRTYKTEFPDFGELDVALPEGFEDASWHNDTHPNFRRKLLGDDVGESHLYLWVDYKDEEKREQGGHPRFHVVLSDRDDDMTMGELLGTDDWGAVLALVKVVFPR